MPVPRRLPRRIATVSVHTSPLEQPGTGDAGGMNVYVVEVAKRLAARGVEVDKERWGVPFVQSMHTLGRVKNAALAAGDTAEPAARIRGEAEVVAAADRLVANTDDEARQLIGLYAAEPSRVRTINPGVDLAVFRPGSRPAAPQRLGLPEDAVRLVFAGRMQPLEAPHVVLHAAAQMILDEPGRVERLTAAAVGRATRHGRDATA